jgi:transcriptional regulator with XRE-family HTH domain
MATRPHTRNALRQARQRRGLSQAQVARLLDCKDRRTIARYERGERLPSLASAVALAMVYHLSVEELFPALAAHVRAEVTRREEEFTRTHQSHAYVSTPHTTTVLTIHPGTRKIATAVFEAFPAR